MSSALAGVRVPILLDVFEAKGRKTKPDPKCGTARVEGDRVVLLLTLEAKTKQSRPVGMSPGATFGEAARIKRLRATVKRGLETVLLVWPVTQRPALVRAVRLSFGRLDDTNLVGALKPVEDGVADALGLNDRDFSMFGELGRIRYEPRQEHCAPGVKGIRVEVEFKPGAEVFGG